MDRPSKDDYVALAAFRKALRTFLRVVEQNARAASVTPQQHQVLLAVMGHPGRDWASVTEIRDTLQLAHNATVGLVDRCQAHGLLERTADEGDRRVVRVALTEKGRELLAEVTHANLAELRASAVLTQALAELMGEEALGPRA